MTYVFYFGSLDKAISCNSGGSHNNPGRAIMDQRRDPGPLKAPDTTGVGHDCDDNGEDGGGGGGGVVISSSIGARASLGERVARRSRGQFSTVRLSN